MLNYFQFWVKYFIIFRKEMSDEWDFVLIQLHIFDRLPIYDFVTNLQNISPAKLYRYNAIKKWHIKREKRCFKKKILYKKRQIMAKQQIRGKDGKFI